MGQTEYKTVGEITVGTAPTPEEAAEVNAAMGKILDAFNALSENLRVTVLISFVTTVCMNTAEPKLTLMDITQMTQESIATFENRPAGHG